jgi:uncharacterized protein
VSQTVDANILVYASNEADEAHGVARTLIEKIAAGPDLAYLFWPAVLGYLRIVTHPAILPRPLTAQDAMANIEGLLAQPHVRTPGETSDFWEVFRTVAGPRVRGNDVPDAHLVALMRTHGVRVIYTRDRDFRRFTDIEARDPFA